MRKWLLHIISTVLVAAGLAACHPIDEPESDLNGRFEAVWTAVNEHYCFFEYKDIDWQAVYDEYKPIAAQCRTQKQMFDVCARMLNELKDGHVNLSASFSTSYYRNWWSDYPQNFNLRLVQENYLNFNYKQLGEVIFGMLAENVGYVHIGSFSSGLSQARIDNILVDLATADGLIIDLRDNGGGSMSYAENWVRHFITAPVTIGYMQHKTGPGPADFDAPYPITFTPLTTDAMVWLKPVVLLTNRSTFSAGNYMVMCMKGLPQVIHAGATTGGGSGIPMSYEMPGGWQLRLSAVRMLDSEGEITEFGIAPTEGYAVDMNPEDEAAGRDTMLDFAINAIK